MTDNRAVASQNRVLAGRRIETDLRGHAWKRAWAKPRAPLSVGGRAAQKRRFAGIIQTVPIAIAQADGADTLECTKDVIATDRIQNHTRTACNSEAARTGSARTLRAIGIAEEAASRSAALGTREVLA